MSHQENRVKREEEKLAKMLEERNAPEQEEEEIVPEPAPQEPKEDLTEEEPKEEDGEEDTGWKKRYGDLRKHSQKTEEKFKAEIEELKKRLDEKETKEFKSTLPASESELEEWKTEHPHAYALVETLIESRTENRLKRYRDEIETLKSSLAEGQNDILKDKAELAIKKAHPDFDELQDDDNFHTWVEKQIKSVQDAVYESTSPEDVIWAIDMYKLTTKKAPSSNREAAKGTRTKEKPQIDPTNEKSKIRESDIQRMSEKEFNDRLEEIEEARRKGNIIWDVSGGAR